MARTQQTFKNDKDGPIYVSVEPWPECFELEPGDKLTLIWDAPDSGDAAQIDFINDRELVVWPNGETHEMQYLINGEEAEERSWTFKHKLTAHSNAPHPKARGAAQRQDLEGSPRWWPRSINEGRWP